jgi:hypothetical protein
VERQDAVERQHRANGDVLAAARARRAELRAAMLDVERALSAPAPGRADAWLARVRGCFGELTEDFRAHLSVTEGPGGLYEEVRANAPRLAGPLRRLEREHGEITAELDRVRCRLEDRGSAELVEDVRDRVTALLATLVRHRQRGADLVWEAFESDIGGET